MLLGQAWAAETKRFYNIPAQTMRDALFRVAEEAELSIGFEDDVVAPLRSPRVIGTLTIEELLHEMLAESGLGYEFVDLETVRIFEQAPVIAPTLSQDGLKVGNMVVSATKRQVDVQKLALSVAVLSGERLAAFGASGISNVAPHIAGVSVTNLGPGRNKIFIRGLSDGTFADRTQSTVAVYLDDAPIIFNDTNPDFPLIDIDQVEIVRGPQGTLYGAGSMGGLYRIVTNKPDPEDSFATLTTTGSATLNGGFNSAFAAVVNAPIVDDRLTFRLAGHYQNDEGYIDDIGLAQVDINDSEIFGGRFALRARLSDAWHVDLALNHQSIDLANTQYFVREHGAFQRRRSLTEPHKDKFRHGTLTFTGTYGWGDVISSSSYIRRDIENTADATDIIPTLTGMDLGPSPFEIERQVKSFSHETRLVSKGDRRFDWLVGAYYARRDERFHSDLFALTQTSLPSLFSEVRDDTFEEIATFGELSIDFLERFTFTGGLRWFQTKLDITSATNGSLAAANPLTARSTRERKVKNKYSLSYRASDDMLIYAQAAQGYRPGGININTPVGAIIDPLEDGIEVFDSDKLWNVELGFKSSFFQKRATFNAAVYHVLWDGIQTDQLLGNGFTFVANAGDARITGVEAEFNAEPIDGLFIGANFFWNATRLIDSNPFLSAQVGERLPGIAAISAGASASYELDLCGDWRGLMAAEYSYVGDSTLTFDPTLASSMGNYHLANIRFQVERGAWQAGIFVDNLFNQKGNTFSFGNPFSLALEDQITPLRPMTAGIVLSRKF